MIARAFTSDYADQGAALLPHGPTWPRDESSTLMALIEVLSAEPAHVHNRAVDLGDESLPFTTQELLPDWEAVAGLPDECAGVADTIQERRDLLVSRLVEKGGQSRQFLIDLAARLGFEITITEYKPWSVGDPVGIGITDDEWWFVFAVNAPEDTIRGFEVGNSTVGEPLRDWGNDILECVINRAKPAHAFPIFTYGA